MSREELKAQLTAVASADHPFPEDRFAGRGIVICAGGARLFTCAWVAIGLLRRHLACTLPIEVWHLGPAEMGPPMRGLLEELGARPVDALEIAKRHQVERLGGWELKPYAVMHSRFREVLLLDADNVPIRDPGFLFDCPAFRDTGTLFWPDIVRLSSDNEIWAISGLSYRDTQSVESGQMVLDKSRCWRALSLSHWINQRSDVFYQFLHGDKDTYLIAWLMLTQPYHLIRHRPKLLEATLCQRDPDGAVLFQHRNGAKWILDGHNPRIAGFRLERECRALLAELATLWDGRVFNPPPRSDEARRLEADLSRSREYRFVRVSSDERRIELLSDHRIRPHREHEHYWHVADGPKGFELRIEGNGLRGCALWLSDDGTWRGRSLQSPGMPVELVPTAGGPVEQRRDGPDRKALMSLLDRILDSGAALPWDREVMRDLAGTLRTLAALDSAVIERLNDENGRLLPGSARAQVVQAALAGLADPSRLPDGGGIGPGHNWPTAPFKAGRDYER
jgi:hypothetical protein